MILAALATFAQAGDLATSHSATETNPLALLLLAAGFALPAKLALLAWVTAISSILERRWPLYLATGAGLLGMVSNVVAGG